MFEWICWLFSIINVIGTLLNIRKMYLCFFIWSVCNVFWLYLDIVTAQYARIILDVINLITSLYGAYCWYKDSKSNKLKNVISKNSKEVFMDEVYEEFLVIDSYSDILENDIDDYIKTLSQQEYNDRIENLENIKEDIKSIRRKASDSLKNITDLYKKYFD